MKEDTSRLDFIELIFPAMAGFGFDERNEIENALNSALGKVGMGYVLSAGTSLGVLELSIEIDEQVRHEPRRVIVFVLDVVSAFEFLKGSYLLAYPTSLQHVEF